MLRSALLAASRSGGVRALIEKAPPTRAVVRRFVAGETTGDALRVTGDLLAGGRLVSLDVLGEDTHDRARADATVEHYAALLGALADAGFGADAEVSLKLTAVGQALDEDMALANARRVCAAAREAGTTVTVDMEDHTLVASTLRVVHALRGEYPDVGAVIQSSLRRAEEYCAELAYEGSRVRLCKGAYAAPAEVAFTGRAEVDASYVRCLKVLMAGQGYPMVATHDPRLVDIASALAVLDDRAADSFEYQMLYGIRPQEQRRLAGQGFRMRVYVAYGTEWYGYFMRRLAERPANLAFFARALAGRS
ncbi:proline dehydrogenase family protein [Actinomadura flavalba]|uniref:proline dehydrogenase family protein n=1 Tax=Actinomadura flavalba TaxID=1120938 RepID=UPI00039D0504|nr:proline dehydrogenase family protein [Actinomadura flavalba]